MHDSWVMRIDQVYKLLIFQSSYSEMIRGVPGFSDCVAASLCAWCDLALWLTSRLAEEIDGVFR